MNKLLIIFLILGMNTIDAKNTKVPSDAGSCTVGNIPIVLIEFSDKDITLFKKENLLITFDVTTQGRAKNIRFSKSSIPKNKLKSVINRFKKYRFMPSRIDGEAYYQTNCKYSIMSSK